MTPIYSIGDEALVITTQRTCYVRETYSDKYAPYYCVSYYKEDIAAPINKNIPRLLFWEFELTKPKKVRTLKNGKQILMEKLSDAK